jgi:hypothetical protein
MVIWGFLQPIIYYIVDGSNLFKREILGQDFDFTREDDFSNLYNAKFDSMSLEDQRLLSGLKPVAQTNRQVVEGYLKGEFNFEDRISSLRSLYMTGFLLGFAKARHLKQVVFVTGAQHIPEIFDFLDG